VLTHRPVCRCLGQLHHVAAAEALAAPRNVAHRLACAGALCRPRPAHRSEADHHCKRVNTMGMSPAASPGWMYFEMMLETQH